MAASLSASVASADIESSRINFQSGDEEIKGFLARPKAPGKYPGIVMIQEWWGLNAWIEDNARRLAERGYVVLAPDLYRGKVTDDPKVAGELRKGLPHDRALRDLKAAVSTLAAHPAVDAGKIGCIGWCMGGQYSLQLALTDNRIVACVVCYGALVTEAAGLAGLNAPVLGIFGETDMGIPPRQVNAFEAALKQAGKRTEGLHIYKGAGHGFMRTFNGPDKPNPAHNPEATRDAWAKIDAFFAKTLQGK